MEPKQKPTGEPGMQNPFCEFFRDCLIDVFNRQWEEWSCIECPQKDNEQDLNSPQVQYSP